MSSRPQRRRHPGAVWALLANLLILAPLVVAFALESANSEAYYRAMQEDELLEWATVWAFLAAVVVLAMAAARQWRESGKLPWFLAGVALFCVFVAGEEISWGQRLLGYRPPAYFLAENFQQELNVHNVIDTSLRKLTFKGVIGGYGILLPLLALAAPVRRQLRRFAVEAPPLALAPGFLVALITYDKYPLSFTGEFVELMVGWGFLCAALAALGPSGEAGRRSRRRDLGRLGLVVLAVLALGAGSAAYSRGQRAADPAILEAARAETEALRRDFLTMTRRNRGRSETRCGVHKRVYSFVEKYDTEYLYEGAFAALTAQGMPRDRADYFLDPWNSPYWIRDKCDRRAGRRIIFVYSFGPNRARDSNEWEIGGDDVGSTIFELVP